MRIHISSGDNSRVKLVRKLKTRKGRSTEGRFTAEGKNLVCEVLSRGLDVDFIMIPDGTEDGLPEAVRQAADSPDIAVCEVPQRVFDDLTDAGTGIGMLAVVRQSSIASSIPEGIGPDDNILILDRIQDPGNMGTLIRTAVAAGYKAVLALSGTADVYSPKVLRATAGMVFEIPIIYVPDETALIGMVRKAGKRIAVTAVEGGVPYFEEDLSKGIALVIGNEGRGVSDTLLDIADFRVTIPMNGRIESLNAAVAAAILMYEAVRAG